MPPARGCEPRGDHLLNNYENTTAGQLKLHRNSYQRRLPFYDDLAAQRAVFIGVGLPLRLADKIRGAAKRINNFHGAPMRRIARHGYFVIVALPAAAIELLPALHRTERARWLGWISAIIRT